MAAGIPVYLSGEDEVSDNMNSCVTLSLPLLSRSQVWWSCCRCAWFCLLSLLFDNRTAQELRFAGGVVALTLTWCIDENNENKWMFVISARFRRRLKLL